MDLTYMLRQWISKQAKSYTSTNEMGDILCNIICLLTSPGQMQRPVERNWVQLNDEGAASGSRFESA
jgi:hypothetical protein